MANLPVNLSERERLKYRLGSSGLPAVAVVNDDGSAIGNSSGGGSSTVYQGNVPWLTELTSAATVIVGNTINSLIASSVTVIPGQTFPISWTAGATISVGNTINALLQAGTNSIGSATVFAGQAFPVTDNAGSLTVDWLSGATVAVSTLPNVTLGAGSSFVGLISTASVQGKVELVSSSAFVGLATVVIGNTLNALLGNVTLNPSPNFIGLISVASINGTVTNAAGTNFIGLISTASINGNVQLQTGTSFVGLMTIVPTYLSTYTSLATILSASGNATIFLPPNGQRFIIKDLLITSLGRGEVEIKSGANTLIPMAALATTGGYVVNAGDAGIRGKAVNDAFVVNLNSSATISLFTNVRFE